MARELVLDVRTPEEYAIGHLPGALNVPLHELEQRLSELGPSDRRVLLYCRSGRRSQIAATFLKQAGFVNVEDRGALSASECTAR